jgi:ABC-type lipoprotein export system ATPase subunit
MSIIECKNIYKTYGFKKQRRDKVEVLKDVSLKIEVPGMYAILGPSGAGKTTLLNILSGLDDPTAGDVSVENNNMSSMDSNKKQRFINQSVGFVFQFYHLFSDLTALENVMLPALIYPVHKKSKIQENALALLKEVGLSNRARHFPSELSGGEEQRVAIARSLINDPRIIYCDEPTGNLDSQTGKEISLFLERLSAKQHKTVLFVTHDDKISEMAEKVFYLKDGKLT